MAGNTRDETLRFQFEAKQQGIDEVNKELDDTKNKSEEAGTAFEFFKKHLEEIISIAAAVELALKAIDFGKESLKNAEAVEVSLSRVKALAGEAADAFGEMDDAVEKAAKDVNVTTQTSASGLAALVGQGLSAKDAIAALIPTLQLAKIANIDVATAAEEVGKQLKAFHLPASDAQKVVDELTSASHGAAGGLGAMSGAAVALAPDAKALGLQFTDVVSILGVLNSKGLDTEKSVRGLRSVFQELQDPTSKLRGELLALGDGTGDFGSAITALSANTPRAHDALLTLSGPARTLVELLGQAGPDAIAKFNEGLQQTQGFAAKTATALDENLKGAATKFGNAIDLIGEKLVKPILEPFAKELEKLAGDLNKFADSPDFKDIEKAVGEMATNAANAIDEFVKNVKWGDLAKDGKVAIQGLSTDFATLAASAKSTAENINSIFAVVGTAYHGVVGTVDGVVGAAASAADSFVTLAEKTGDLTGTGDELRKSTEGVHAALESVANVALDKMDKHTTALRVHLKALGLTEDDVTDSTKKTGEAAGDAAPKVEAHGEAAAKAAQGTGQLKAELGLVPDYFARTSEAALAAAPALGHVSDEARKLGGGPLHDAKIALADAIQALADLQKAGNATPEAMEAAGRAVLAAGRELDKLTKSGNDAAEALKTAAGTLHITLQAQLEKAAADFKGAFETIDKGSAQTAAGLADRQKAFLAYAQAALAATAGLDQGAKDSTSYSLDQKAAVLGVTSALADLEAQSSQSSAALVSDASRGAESLSREASQAERLSRHLSSSGGGGGSDSGVPPVDKAAADATAMIQRMGNDGGSSLAQLDDALANTRAGLLGISEGAAKAFDARFYGDFFTAFDGTGIGFTKVINGMALALSDTNAQIANERTQLNQTIGSINEFGTAGSKAFDATGNATAGEVERMQSLSASIKDGSYQFGILGQQELGPLQQALDGAIQRAQALKAAAEQASQQIADLDSQLQDDIDQANGNKTAVENSSYERQKQNILNLEKTADAAGKASAEQALQRLNELHQIRLKQIADEAAAQNNAGKPPSGPKPPAAPTPAGPGAPGGGGGSSGVGGAGISLQPIHIHLDGQLQGTVYGNQQTAQMLASLLAARNNSI